jgi:hypothetical protein
MAVSSRHHGRSSVSRCRREWRSILAHELIGPPRQDMDASFREKWLAAQDTIRSNNESICLLDSSRWTWLLWLTPRRRWWIKGCLAACAV